MSTPPISLGSNRRPQARRKQTDDSAYIGPASAAAAAKRQAAERAEGEPKSKRKKVDSVRVVSGSAGGRREPGAKQDGEVTICMVRTPVILAKRGSEYVFTQVQFNNMTTATLYKYMSYHELVPYVSPSPLSYLDPPPPYRLADPPSRPPTPPPANTGTAARRDDSQREAEGDEDAQAPVLADISEVHGTLASVVERHFREQTGGREIDVLASFMCAVDREKTSGRAVRARYGSLIGGRAL
jgi:hypothetical protein